MTAYDLPFTEYILTSETGHYQSGPSYVMQRYISIPQRDHKSSVSSVPMTVPQNDARWHTRADVNITYKNRVSSFAPNTVAPTRAQRVVRGSLFYKFIILLLYHVVVLWIYSQVISSPIRMDGDRASAI